MRRLIPALLIGFVMVHPVSAQRTVAAVPLPDSGYRRIPAEPGSFGAWLGRLPLKPPGSPVLDYRLRIYKTAEDTAVAAVIDMDIAGRRLEQCMDILVRLYAQYLWESKRSGELRLPLPGGWWLAWADWSQGVRPVFRGTDVSHVRSAAADASIEQYQAYLRTVYAESHTQQFYHRYTPVPPEAVRAGDFFVLKGSRSHAVMVVDMMTGPDGRKYALIGHGDTPACQFHLLNHTRGQPWILLEPAAGPLPLPIRRRMTWDGLRRFPAPEH